MNKTDLLLFELKTAGNSLVGILSELFFYSYIMEAVQQKRVELQKPDQRIASTGAARAYILALDRHPLIDDAFRGTDRRIRFGAVRVTPDQPQAYVLEMQACD